MGLLSPLWFCLITTLLFVYTHRSRCFYVFSRSLLVKKAMVHPWLILFHLFFNLISCWNFFLKDYLLLVRPNPPSEVSMESPNPYSIELWYKIDDKLHFFPPGLRQDVEVRSEFDLEGQWRPLDIPFVNTAKDIQDVNHTITGLNPYTTYTVKIRMQSMKADPHLWSQTVMKESMTMASKPEIPPEVTLSSFEVVNHDWQTRSIFVYWKQIPRWRQNGPDFNYIITEVAEAGRKR